MVAPTAPWHGGIHGPMATGGQRHQVTHDQIRELERRLNEWLAPRPWWQGKCVLDVFDPHEDHRYGGSLYSYGKYSLGLYSYGLCSYDFCSYGTYSYGLYSYGLCSDDISVMAFVVLTCIVMPYVRSAQGSPVWRLGVGSASFGMVQERRRGVVPHVRRRIA